MTTKQAWTILILLCAAITAFGQDVLTPAEEDWRLQQKTLEEYPKLKEVLKERDQLRSQLNTLSALDAEGNPIASRNDVMRAKFEEEKEDRRLERGIPVSEAKSFMNNVRNHGFGEATGEHLKRHWAKYLAFALTTGYAIYEAQDDGGSSKKKAPPNDPDVFVQGNRNDVDADGADTFVVVGNENNVTNREPPSDD